MSDDDVKELARAALEKTDRGRSGASTGWSEAYSAAQTPEARDALLAQADPSKPEVRAALAQISAHEPDAYLRRSAVALLSQADDEEALQTLRDDAMHPGLDFAEWQYTLKCLLAAHPADATTTLLAILDSPAMMVAHRLEAIESLVALDPTAASQRAQTELDRLTESGVSLDWLEGLVMVLDQTETTPGVEQLAAIKKAVAGMDETPSPLAQRIISAWG